MGYQQLAESRLKMDANGRKLILKPLDELRSSTQLITNIRDLQAIEAGEEKSELIDVCKMLEDIKKEYENLPGRDVKITLHGEDQCLVQVS